MLAPGDDDVMRRQDRESAPTGTPAGDEHAACLGDEGVTGADSRVTCFHFAGFVAAIGAQNREAKGITGSVGQFMCMRCHFFPAFGNGDFT